MNSLLRILSNSSDFHQYGNFFYYMEWRLNMDRLIHKSSRAFNNVVIDRKYGIVHKSSSDYLKLNAEAYWYCHLPIELLGFAPSFIFSKDIPDGAEITIEYCPFKTLSELFTDPNALTATQWIRIIRRLLEVHDLFRLHSPESSKEVLEEIKDFHINKTSARLKYLLEENPYFVSLTQQKEIIINNRTYSNIDFPRLHRALCTYVDRAPASVVHGDYCLSNILYNLETDSVKLIDPRGFLTAKTEPTIYGDPNYDLAKLMHSVHGCYDYLVQGKYSLIQLGENKYDFNIIKRPEYHSSLISMIEEKFRCEEENFRHRRLLELLLFLTMIPLHYDDPKRQLAFYLRAVLMYHEYMIYLY
jgi:hypothetical protein